MSYLLQKKSKATIKCDDRLIINLSSFIIKHIVNIDLMRVEEHEHNFSQFLFNMIFMKRDRVNKQLFKWQFFILYSQRSNDSLFILNNTVVNDRSSKVNDIFYVEFNSLLWENIYCHEFKTLLTAHEKVINAIKNVITIVCMTEVDNEKYESWTNFIQKSQLNALMKYI